MKRYAPREATVMLVICLTLGAALFGLGYSYWQHIPATSFMTIMSGPGLMVIGAFCGLFALVMVPTGLAKAYRERKEATR